MSDLMSRSCGRNAAKAIATHRTPDLDELARFTGPAIGAISTIGVTWILRRPAS
jgi:hypothetical protein